ncbi:hypothetical protein D3C87_457860 [compost metagenome]
MRKNLLRLVFLTFPLFGFSQTYCGPLPFGTEVEPISQVNFAGINNTTSAEIDGSPAHEFFLDQQGSVIKGLSYDITLKGNTNDFIEFGFEFTSNFMVFVDWNRDGDFADDGETFSVGSITGSSGTDSKQIVYSIAVPSTATPGITRLRVKKIFGTTNLADPCLGGNYGQAEDYTLNVLDATPCVGAPAIGTATSSVTNICLGTSFVLTSNTPATAGYKYQWQSSTDGGTSWVNLGNSQDFTNYTVASQSAESQYRLIVTCTDSNLSSTSNVVTVTQNAPNQCYCTNAVPFVCSDGDVIQNVTFGGINNNSQCGNSTTGYSNYTTSVAAGNVSAGSVEQFSVRVGPSGDGWLYESVGVWIDYNQNGVFESNEYTFIGTGLNQVLTKSITIPAGALLGSTRMRVVVAASTEAAFTEEYKCGPLTTTNPYGEMEDYTLNIGQLAVSETAKNNIKSYPNPVKDIFNIEAQGKIKSVKVYDVAGKQILTKDLNDVKSQIDFSRFGAGVYVVTTLLEDGTSTSTKVIKK